MAGHPSDGVAGRVPSRRLLTALSAALVAVGLLAACTQVESIRPPAPPHHHPGEQAQGAQAALDRLVGDLRRGRSVANLAAAPTWSSGQLRALAANYRRVGITGLALRYVSSAGAATPSEQAALGRGTFTASVQVRYRIRGYDHGVTGLDTAFVFVPTRSGIRIGAIGGHGDREALWLQQPVRVRRTPRTLVLAAPGEPVDSLAAHARTAVRQVDLVLHRWTGSLVLEAPGSEAELDAILGAPRSRYANIAAVTTTVDGSTRPGTPVHVYLNPAVFNGLKPKGAQVVLTHETTHVATRASFAIMPTWLVEGFADFVALDHAGVPVQVAARQYLAHVRRAGLPRHLPTPADLAPTAPHLGATYEAAWLACRSIGLHFGTRAMVRFYDAVDRGTSVARAFPQVLGLSQPRFVRLWRSDLAGLAGAHVAGHVGGGG